MNSQKICFNCGIVHHQHAFHCFRCNNVLPNQTIRRQTNRSQENNQHNTTVTNLPPLATRITKWQ
ncbi:MAG TPA: hypothetical protein VLL52_07785 [Anaerolineae bacterium]|nr:hypothetical protein [Anaerolineae bacterium]